MMTLPFDVSAVLLSRSLTKIDIRNRLDRGLLSMLNCGRARLTATGMDIPEMFLLAEAVLIGLDNVTDGLVVYPARIRSRFLDELPFMVTEAVSVHFTDSDDSLLIICRSS